MVLVQLAGDLGEIAREQVAIPLPPLVGRMMFVAVVVVWRIAEVFVDAVPLEIAAALVDQPLTHIDVVVAIIAHKAKYLAVPVADLRSAVGVAGEPFRTLDGDLRVGVVGQRGDPYPAHDPHLLELRTLRWASSWLAIPIRQLVPD